MTVAVIGTGSAGRRHMANLIAHGRQHVVAVSEHRKCSDLEIHGHQVPVSHDFERLLADDPSIDSVFICNPSSMHSDYLLRSVQANKHAYVEKPIAKTLDEVSGIRTSLGSHPVTVAIGNQFRFHPHLISIKKMVDNGTLGDIFSVHAIQGEHIADYHPGEDYRQSYTARRALGGGILLTQIHQIDYLHWLFGPFKTVMATQPRERVLKLDVEENVSYLLTSDNGTIVYGHVDYLRRPKHASLCISGSKGTLEWSYYENSLKWVNLEKDAEIDISYHSEDRNQLFVDAALDFLNAIDEHRNPRSTLIDGLNALSVVQSIHDSSLTKQMVKIKNFDEIS